MGLAGESRFDLAAAGQVRRTTPGKPCTASLGDKAEIDDGQAGAGAERRRCLWTESGVQRCPGFARFENVRYSVVTLRQVSRRGGTGRRDRLRIYYR